MDSFSVMNKFHITSLLQLVVVTESLPSKFNKHKLSLKGMQQA